MTASTAKVNAVATHNRTGPSSIQLGQLRLGVALNKQWRPPVQPGVFLLNDAGHVFRLDLRINVDESAG